MNKSENELIGQRLKDLRKKSEMNQTQISDIIGVKRETYASWEIGRSGPKYDSLLKIAKLYNVSVEYILTGNMPNSFTVNSTNEYNSDIYGDNYVNELSSFEKTILMKIRMLNLSDKEKLADFIDELKPDK